MLLNMSISSLCNNLIKLGRLYSASSNTLKNSSGPQYPFGLDKPTRKSLGYKSFPSSFVSAFTLIKRLANGVAV